MRCILLLLFVGAGYADNCDPDQCVLPNCRCYNDPNIPGKLQAKDTPQIVVVSFENVIDTSDVDLYLSLLKEKNPNGCPARGSFYIEDAFSNYAVVYELFKDGHEIGINSLDGNPPSDWNNMYKSVLSKLASAGIESKDIHGTRVPRLEVGGNEQFIGMGDNNILYDTSCVSVQYSTNTTLLWPFTNDVMPVPACDIGKAPSTPFPGLWEFMLADLRWNDQPCATPSGCTAFGLKTKQNSFDMFYNAFKDHRTDNKAPFMMIVDPAFAKNQELIDGAVEFLQYIRAAYKYDTWIVTAYQALEWIRNPTPIDKLADFAPWKC